MTALQGRLFRTCRKQDQKHRKGLFRSLARETEKKEVGTMKAVLSLVLGKTQQLNQSGGAAASSAKRDSTRGYVRINM